MLLLVGCSNLPQPLDSNKFYRRDIAVEVNGQSFEGVSVIPRASEYRMKIKPKGELNMVLITSCHREDSFTPGSKGGGLFSKKDPTFDYTYRPQAGLEDSYCPLRINAFDKSNQGQHSWAFMDFTGPETLQATMACNGELSVGNGVSVCQSKAQLIQSIRFPKNVRLSPDKECDTFPEKYGREFQFAIPLGECVYAFLSDDGEVHRLTTVGYQGVLVRDEAKPAQTSLEEPVKMVEGVEQ